VRGPKRLSQVKVDPSIARSLVVPKFAASGQPRAADPQPPSAAPILDLFGDSGPQPQASVAPAASVGSSRLCSWK